MHDVKIDSNTIKQRNSTKESCRGNRLRIRSSLNTVGVTLRVVTSSEHVTASEWTGWQTQQKGQMQKGQRRRRRPSSSASASYAYDRNGSVGGDQGRGLPPPAYSRH